MKSTELRIGNWVQLENYTKYNIEPHHFQLNEDGYSEVLDLTIPIPLTEEILLKCGFDAFTDFDALDIIINGKKFLIPKHLHQLQNLYFALTGEELEINL